MQALWGVMGGRAGRVIRRVSITLPTQAGGCQLIDDCRGYRLRFTASRSISSAVVMVRDAAW